MSVFYLLPILSSNSIYKEEIWLLCGFRTKLITLLTKTILGHRSGGACRWLTNARTHRLFIRTLRGTKQLKTNVIKIVITSFSKWKLIPSEKANWLLTWWCSVQYCRLTERRFWVRTRRLAVSFMCGLSHVLRVCKDFVLVLGLSHWNVTVNGWFSISM